MSGARTDALHLVGGDRHTHARPAYEDPAIGQTRGDEARSLHCDMRIVDLFPLRQTRIDDLIHAPIRFEILSDQLLVAEASRVSSNNNAITHYRSSRCWRSEEHTSELQSRQYLVCRLL